MAILELSIKNLVLVREVDLEFSPGLNIITGETGAGKSLLINGLNIIVGERTTPDLIGRYGKSAEISAVFSVTPDHRLLLEGMGVEPEDDVIIIRRVLRPSGSRAYINGTPVTRSQLKKLTSLLIDIHGQHTHQLLLDESTHIRFLDRFGGLEELVSEVRRRYFEWQNALDRLKSERQRLDELQRMKEFIEFQLNELRQAELKENEDVEIEEKLNILSNIERIKQAVEGALRLVYEDEDSAHSRVSRALKLMQEASEFDPALKGQVESLDGAESLLSEIGTSLAAYIEDLVYDPDELEQLNERLALINRLKHKYRKDLKGLIELQAELERQLRDIELGDIKFRELETLSADREKAYFEVAQVLSEKRRQAAREFTSRVEAELAELGMEDARFIVEIETSEPSEYGIDSVRFAVSKPTESGIDTVRFMISTIPGEEPRPLMKIVSGGELSRIMLALKVVLAEVDEVETLVFDEIDVGISGRIAEAVGRKMKRVSRKRQVITVTHLPQIAAFADRHFKVEKLQGDDGVESRVVELDFDGRVMEIASMLTGERITDASIEQARELLKLAQSTFENHIFSSRGFSRSGGQK